MKKLRMVELFGGYGATKQGIKEANVDCESVGISEWNVYSLIAYDATHTDDGIDYSEGKTKKELVEELSKFTFSTDGSSPCDIKKLKEDLLRKLYSANKRSKNLGSIIDLKVEDIPDCDLITYSFPCTSISGAGKMEGFTKDSGTASSLLWECDRIIKAKKPKYLLMENVKNLISKKFKPEFDKWCKLLEDYGYKNYYQVLNAKDYELPQNRERVFMVSVRNDIDETFIFPDKMELKFRLKDFLDDEVEDNYYLSEEYYDRFLNSNFKMDNDIKIVGTTVNPQAEGTNSRRWVHDTSGIIGTIDATTYKQPKQILVESPIRIGNIYGEDKGTGFAGNVWDKEAISPTLTTMQGGNRQPMVVVEPKIQVVGNYSPSGHEASRIVHSEGLAPTVKENHGTVTGVYIGKSIKNCVAKNFEKELDKIAISDKEIYQAQCDSGWQDNKIGLKISQTIRANNSFAPVLDNNFTIRKLTPLECFRLMGMSDENFYKIKAKGISDSQLYKLAGNSICVNVLKHIFINLFKSSN